MRTITEYLPAPPELRNKSIPLRMAFSRFVPGMSQPGSNSRSIICTVP